MAVVCVSSNFLSVAESGQVGGCVLRILWTPSESSEALSFIFGDFAFGLLSAFKGDFDWVDGPYIFGSIWQLVHVSSSEGE